MTGRYESFVDVVETWLDNAPGDEDPESVLARVVAELDATSQRRHPWTDWLQLHSSLAVGFSLGAAATIAVAVIGAQLLGGTGPGAGTTPTLPSSSPTGSPSPISRPYPTPDLSSVPPVCPFDGRHPAGAGTDSTPASEIRGLVGLPAEGATPSAPEHGQLVDCWPVDGGRLPYRGMVRLYADGRLIWNYYTPSISPDRTTGHIEQRLTAEGVSLLRGQDDVALKDPLRLGEWLPASVWEDQTMRSYVPSAYGACIVVDDDHNVFPLATLAEKLAMLPPDVAVLLRDRTPVLGGYGSTSHCLGLDTEAARALAEALRQDGFEQNPLRNQYLLEYHMDADGSGPGTTVIGVWFEPVFPDGSIGCSGCG